MYIREELFKEIEITQNSTHVFNEHLTRIGTSFVNAFQAENPSKYLNFFCKFNYCLGHHK